MTSWPDILSCSGALTLRKHLEGQTSILTRREGKLKTAGVTFKPCYSKIITIDQLRRRYPPCAAGLPIFTRVCPLYVLLLSKQWLALEGWQQVKQGWIYTTTYLCSRTNSLV
jgi:hypothetical protein